MTAPDGASDDLPTGLSDSSGLRNAQQFTDFVAEHGPGLHRYLVARFGDRQLAHDAVQAAYAKLIEHRHEVEAENWKAWLYQVAYREGLVVRRRQQVNDGALRKLAHIRPTAYPSPGDPLVVEEQIKAVRMALQNLPADQRQVVQMRIFEQKTFAQIALEIGIPLGTALGRMRAAMEKLRRCLSPPDTSAGNRSD